MDNINIRDFLKSNFTSFTEDLEEIFPDINKNNFINLEYESDSLLYINNLGFNFSIKTESFNENLHLNNSFYEKKHTIILKNSLYFSEIDFLLNELNNKYIKINFGLYFLINEKIKNESDTVAEIDFTLKFDTSYNKTKISVLYKFDFLNFKIKIYSGSNGVLDVFIKDKDKNFNNIQFNIRTNEITEDFFYCLAKKITEKINIYNLESDMKSNNLYDFLKLNANDIYYIKKMINY